MLNGQRADGRDVPGKEVQSATMPLRGLFALDAASRPNRDQMERILAGQTIHGAPLSSKEAGRAVERFTAAMGANSKKLSPEQREHILAGRRADGGELTDRAYRAAIETSKSRVGYIDLTFSAPKSLSVAWAFAPTPAERAILHQAHTDAIDDVLRTIEKQIGRARKGKGGKDGFEPGSIGWASFDHYAARPTVEIVRPGRSGEVGVQAGDEVTTEIYTITGTGGRVPGDMQIHTHVAIFNAVETASGRVGGLDLGQLEGRIHEWGALYQAYLAKNLRFHGVEVALDPKTEMARLTAVPEKLVALFSKRTMSGADSARAYAASLGLDWDSLDPDRKIGLLKSSVQNPRAAKSDDVSDMTTWRKMADSINYQHQSILTRGQVKSGLSREERLEAAYQAAMPLLDKRFERSAVIEGADARVVAAKSLIAVGVEVAEDIDALTRIFFERGVRRRGETTGLIWGNVVDARGKEKILITTALDEREEKSLVDTVRDGGSDKTAGLTLEQVEAAVAGFPDINFANEHGQAQRAVIDKLGTGGRIGLAIGVAGSGKSTLLKPLVKAWQDDGRVVHGIALAWRQSDDLVDAGIARSNTRAVASFLRGAEVGSIPLDRQSVVVVDEVGLLGTRQLNDILALQRKGGFQLVMIGDPKQMQSVDAGPVIDLLRRGLGAENVPELGSSVRQSRADERETTLMLRNGQVAEALDRKDANGTLRIVPGGYRDAIAHVADLWQQRREANRDRPHFTVTVSAPTNTEAHDISLAIRERRRAMGEVGADQTMVYATDGVRDYRLALAPGDRVRLFERTNAKFTGSNTVGNIGRNGTVLEVVAVRNDGLLLRNPAGKEGLVAWTTLQDPANKRIKLAYGDALTTHTAQGSTVTEHIHAMLAGSWQVSAFGAYTSGSRHKEQSFIVVSEGMERSQVVGRRPLGDRRNVTRDDILDNIKRQLARQPEKASATSLIESVVNLRRTGIHTSLVAHQSMQSRKAAGLPATTLPERFAERRAIRALEERLPALTELLRQRSAAVDRMVLAGHQLAERIVTHARRLVEARRREAHRQANNDKLSLGMDDGLALRRRRGIKR